MIGYVFNIVFTDGYIMKGYAKAVSWDSLCKELYEIFTNVVYVEPYSHVDTYPLWSSEISELFDNGRHIIRQSPI
jgi:hypothetical protein